VTAVGLAVPLVATGAARDYKQGTVVAHLRPATGQAVLRDAPHAAAPVAARVGQETLFETRTSFAVVDARRGWAKVGATELGNRARAWLPLAQIRLSFDPYSLEIDLSRKRLRVWRRGELAREIAVGIGAAGSPTPVGHFSVTDKLQDFVPEVYGCCILALSAHQPNLPADWTGGDRIAIHGGPGEGSAVSGGCLHATEAQLRWLLRHIPTGTAIVIHP
jgi:lipoprotein-anchoring transpeptidase ErfK/SrfK